MALRIVQVQTPHGDFLRLMYVTERNGEVVSIDPVHEYFQEMQEIALRLDHIADALMLPVISGLSVSYRH